MNRTDIKGAADFDARTSVDFEVVTRCVSRAVRIPVGGIAEIVGARTAIPGEGGGE